MSASTSAKTVSSKDNDTENFRMVVQYFATDELYMLKDAYRMDNYQSLKPGDIVEVGTIGNKVTPVVVLGTGNSSPEAMRKASEYLHAQKGNSENSKVKLLHYDTDCETEDYDSDATYFSEGENI